MSATDPDAAVATPELNWVRTGPRGSSPVVLIHPVGFDLTYWGDQIEALRSTHDVVAFDLPGHGRSAGGPADVTFGRLAAAVAGLVGQLGAGPAHVVGVSVGGMVAQTVALSYPHRVRSLTLAATASTFSDAGRAVLRARAEAIRTGGMAAVVRPFLDRWFTPETIAGRPDLMDRITKTLLGDDPAVQTAMWTMIAGLDLADRLGEVDRPTLVLVGDRDPSTPPAMSVALAERVRGARLIVLPGASHMVHLEQPDAVNAEVSAFLSRVDGGGGR